MNRRNFFHSLPGVLAALWLPKRSASAKEMRGKWTKEWVVKYSMSLIDWTKEDLVKRSSLLKTLAEIDAPLDFKYFHGTLDKKDQAYHDRFLAARLSDKDTEAHIANFLKELEAVRAVVAAKEAEAAPKWKSDLEGDVPLKEGKIFESSISSRRLGVILDNSPSMTPYLEKLRLEINRDFSGCHIVEVDGCEMWQGGGSFPWFHSAPAAGINPFTPERHCPAVPQSEAHIAWVNWTRDTQSAFSAMLTLMKVDATYWFCDFDDEIMDEEIKKIAALIFDNKAKLFVHTLSKSPPKIVATLAERSGGKVIRKRLR